MPSVVDYSKGLKNVVHAEASLFACSTDTAKEISNTIRKKGLNRVVVAACTPRTHEPLFRDTLREGGINQYFYDMANIREHCSWVHSKEKDSATLKAKDLVRMSVARSSQLEPLKEFDLPVDKRAVVVGGGLAGMTSALGLARQGFEVSLLEKKPELGGMARRVRRTLEGMDIQAHLDEMIQKIYHHPLIHVFHDTTITEVSGYVGNFVTRLMSEGRHFELHHGAVILATGADEYKPTEYLYGRDERVVTQLELEDFLDKEDKRVMDSQSLVMIQCVGSRQEGRNYCSRVCCGQAVKNALRLKELKPEMEIYILYRDMRTYGFREDFYREAASKDVKFIRWEPEHGPQVESVEEDGRGLLRIRVPDQVLGKELEIDADTLVLSAAVVPSASSKEMAKLFKVSLNPDGFLQEAHVKLRPVDFSAEGVFLCGINHYPKHVTETISQALGAAGRAASLLSHDTITASGSVCEVDEDECISCGACISACTYGAIEFYDTAKGKKAKVNPVLCKGDGLCNAKCPTSAISLKHYTDDEVFYQIDSALEASMDEPALGEVNR